MDITERKKFYEKVYFYELDRRDQIYMKLRLPITVLTFTASVNFFLITKLLASYIASHSTANIIGIAAILLSILILIYLLRCIYRVLIGWVYNEISLQDFEKYYDKLVEHYESYDSENHNEQEAKLMAEEIIEKTLTRQLVEYAHHNRKINLARGNYIVKFIKALPFYLLLLALLYTVAL